MEVVLKWCSIALLFRNEHDLTGLFAEVPPRAPMTTLSRNFIMHSHINIPINVQSRVQSPPQMVC